MRKVLSLLGAAAFLLSAAGARAAEAGSECVLQYRAFKNLDEMLGLTLGGDSIYLGAQERLAQSAPAAPIGARTPIFFEVERESAPRKVACVLAKASVLSRQYDRLWLDWNADRKFADSELVRGTTVKREAQPMAQFGPIEHTAADGKKLPAFYLLIRQSVTCQVMPAGLREGEVTLGGKKLKIAVVDRNLNGYFDDPAIEDEEGDLLLVDANGDGVFAGCPEGDWTSNPWSNEVTPVSPVVQMPGGAYYRLTVAEDGSRIAFTPDPAPGGRVKLACAPFAVVLSGVAGRIYARSNANELSVPAGSYRLQSVVMGQRDAEGKVWRASSSYYGAGPRVRVAAGTVADIHAGPPFRMELTTQSSPYADGTRFDLSLRDQDDNELDEVVTPSGDQPKPPTLRITTASGKLVKDISFEYG